MEVPKTKPKSPEPVELLSPESPAKPHTITSKVNIIGAQDMGQPEMRVSRMVKDYND